MPRSEALLVARAGNQDPGLSRSYVGSMVVHVLLAQEHVLVTCL